MTGGRSVPESHLSEGCDTTDPSARAARLVGRIRPVRVPDYGRAHALVRRG
jgi:hypothetical protein